MWQPCCMNFFLTKHWQKRGFLYSLPATSKVLHVIYSVTKMRQHLFVQCVLQFLCKISSDMSLSKNSDIIQRDLAQEM